MKSISLATVVPTTGRSDVLARPRTGLRLLAPTFGWVEGTTMPAAVPSYAAHKSIEIAVASATPFRAGRPPS